MSTDVDSAPFDLIPYVTVHPTSVNVYHQVIYHRGRLTDQRIHNLKGTPRATNGKISPNAYRKIKRSIDYLLYLANEKSLPGRTPGSYYGFKVAFITLTLPAEQAHTDQEIKHHLLNQFLVEIRRRNDVRNYVWRAEKQRNGNIHFHILIDKFIPWEEMRDRWNRICAKLGYLDRFFMRHGHYVPNSTDIHSIRKVKSTREYLLKYCTKPDPHGEIDGQLWGCSESLSNLRGGTEVIDQSLAQELVKVAALAKDTVYKSDYFTVYPVSVAQLLELGCSELVNCFSAFTQDRFQHPVQGLVPI